jgi:1-acyl-sn-glycerol-3-phosphate acyltransferase
MIGAIKSILSIVISAWWCGVALVCLMISPSSARYTLITLAKKRWSIPMLKWIVRMPLEVDIDPATLELLESGQGAVLVANHASYLDVNVAFATSPAPIVFLAKASLRKVPLLGGANARVGTVFVERGNKESALQAISALDTGLKKGRCVLVFPEGTRCEKGHRGVRKFKKGGFHLAANAGAPVIPVHFGGVGAWLPKGDFKITKAGVVKVKYGAPIYSTNVDELRDKCYDAVVAMSNEK